MGRRCLTLALLSLAALLAVHEASAQGRGIVDRFPTPQQVVKDFGNDPSRRVALQILYFALQEKAPAPRSGAASQRIPDYFRAFGEVDYRYDKQGANSVARKNYYARVRQLLSDPNFKSAVLNRYRLANLSAERPVRPPARVGTSRPDSADGPGSPSAGRALLVGDSGGDGAATFAAGVVLPARTRSAPIARRGGQHSLATARFITLHQRAQTIRSRVGIGCGHDGNACGYHVRRKRGFGCVLGRCRVGARPVRARDRMAGNNAYSDRRRAA